MNAIPSLPQTLTQLFASARLFITDKNSIAYFGDTPTAFWQSFFCAAVIAPAYFILVALSDQYGTIITDASTGRIVTVEAIAYVIGWVIWPLAADILCRMTGKGEHYIRYIVAYNWLSAPVVLLFLGVTLLEQIIPDTVGIALSLAALAWRFRLHFFLAQNVLKVPFTAALPFVFGDFILGQMVLAWRTVLLMTPQ